MPPQQRPPTPSAPGPSSRPEDRRRNVRVLVHAPVTLLVVFPEETFSPRPMSGYSMDLSLSGMRVVTRQTPESFYRKVLQGVRYAKVSTQLPGVEQPVTFHGRIVWIEFDNKIDPPCCTYGVAFERLQPEQMDALERCINQVSKSTVSGIGPGVPLSPRPASGNSGTGSKG